jgi:hypothetical protein
VVAGDDHHRAELAQPGQRLVREPDRLDGRQRAVVEVPRDEDRVHRVLARDVREMVDRRRLGVEQRLPVEGAAQVPVRGVQQAHPTQGVATGGRNVGCLP